MADYIRNKEHAAQVLTKLWVDTDTDIDTIIMQLCNYHSTSELEKLIKFIEDETS